MRRRRSPEPRPPRVPGRAGIAAGPGVLALVALLALLSGAAPGWAAVPAVAPAATATAAAETPAAPKTSVEDATALRVLAEEATALRTDIMNGATIAPAVAAHQAHESRQAAARGEWWEAISHLRQALKAGYAEPGRWLTLSDLYDKAEGPQPRAALAAYLHASESLAAGARVEGLVRTADLLMASDRDDLALILFRRAQTLLPTDRATAAIAALTGSGLTVRRTQVEADRDVARLCLELTAAPATKPDHPLSDYVSVEPAVEIAVSAVGKRLCLDGLPHGRDITVTLRPGLPSAAGGALSAPVSVTQAIPNRTPRAAFAGDAHILPARGVREVALRTVNLSQIWLTLSRVNERGLAFVLRDRGLRSAVSEDDVHNLAEDAGEQVWQGRLDIENQPNQEVATAIPMARLLPHPEPGLYLLTAEDRLGEATPWWRHPFQWLLITDIGLQAASGQDGLSVFARSLATGKPLTGATLTLVARNNEELGQATTDRNGMARFQPGQLAGTGGRTASWVMAHGPDGDFAYLDITGPAFDLSDRGVSGRAVPGPLDAFLYGDRGIYRPGETVHLTALLRDEAAKAVPGVPLTLKILRPDGVQVAAQVLSLNKTGAGVADVPLLREARTGLWEITAHVDPAAPPVGRWRFQVEDFAPRTMTLALTASAPALDLTTPTAAPVTLTAQADYLYGAPAANQPLSAAATLEIDPEPFAAYKEFHFGLVQETLEPRRLPLPEARTDAQGAATLEVSLSEPLPDTSHPLRALIRAEVADLGGHGAARTVIVPVRHLPLSLGIRPSYSGDTVDEGTTPSFSVVALDPAGAPVAGRTVDWTLVEEVSHFTWYESGGAWSYRRTVTDEPRASGRLTTDAQGLAQVATPIEAGAYRLEVSDGDGTLAAASVRLRAGWWTAASDERDTPDTLKVVHEGERHVPGDRARIHLEAPFAGEALISVVSDRVLDVLSVSLPREGLTVELPVTEAWGVGAYVVATAFRPGDGAGPQGPGRAMGVVWVPVDTGNRRLAVSLDLPERVRPQTHLDVPITVTGARGPVSLTLAAVDEGILQLTDFTSPDPVGHYLGKRALGLDYRDAYGRLLRAPDARPGRLREGGDASGRALDGLPPTSVRTVALFSGLVTTDAQGHAKVPLDLPDFDGRLRLMVVAFTPEAVGQADASVVVRDPLVALASLPRFLAPGDSALFSVTLDNQDGPAGPWTVAVTTDGAVGTEASAGSSSVTLAPGEHTVVRTVLKGLAAGTGRVTLSLTGPDGFARETSWPLAVRPAAPRTTVAHALDLPGHGRGTLPPAVLAGLDPASVALGLDLSTVPNLAPLTHARALARYPYGCLEQTISRAEPALAALTPGEESWWAPGAPKDALAHAIARVIGLQRADGGFALWRSTGGVEPWLSAYAMDFLLRAKDAGVAVPAFALERGLAYLDGLVASGDLADPELPTAAYAHYVLARAKAGDIASVRHFFDTYGARLPGLMPRAQTAAALALLGDRARASAALAPPPASTTPASPGAAVVPAAVQPGNDDDATPAPWSDALTVRDQAGALALALEANLPGFDPLAAANALALAANAVAAPSTQERAWLVRAAHALAQRQGSVMASVGGQAVTGERASISLPVDPARLKDGLAVVNESPRPLRVTLAVDGQPQTPPPAMTAGLTVTRRFTTLDGHPADLAGVRQNDLLVAVIEGSAPDPRILGAKTPVLVVDLLPAGFVIENPEVGEGQGTQGLDWLPALSTPDHAEARDDRFAAAVSLTPETPGFTLAYVVRAVTPGTFTLPGVAAESMLRPSVRGAQAGGSVTVVAR
ncbi:alpha-2-macroglobulin family protein [Pararhodospirillum oryzae]|uniref:Alpha-2-macroglobulin n=1 Tax=Pararhodospirillum oryzae TaxID=478448 RepID=A0A512H4L4_9PROT|nr:alpha-2-macroglobulin [Pararhodospirillum oryzae]GEO80392.1 alpha-2-macroglobulin [Pararhodospirillum oryzae]